MEKPWLDDPLFKEKLKFRNKLYAKMKKGYISQKEELKLSELIKEVSRIRSKLKREYFTPTIAGEYVNTVEIDATPGEGVIDGTGKAEDGGGKCQLMRLRS